MKHKQLSTTDGDVVHIYDDVFPHVDRLKHMIYCHGSNYKICEVTSSPFSDKQYYLKCSLNSSEVDDFNFFNNLNINKIIREHIGDEIEVTEAWILASTPTLSGHVFHTDDIISGTILSYCVNIDWNPNWHGGTMFANKSNECEINVPYVPGRVTVYDGATYHASGPVIGSASQIRFMFLCHVKSK